VAKAKKTKKLLITQVRSASGRQAKHRRTLRALGLRHHQQSVVQNDTPAVRGMIRRISYMLNVEEVEE
jgi:large subunit ribosomal protein L30